jgi:RNA polymerase sigma-70 factor (ECF subfamily)
MNQELEREFTEFFKKNQASLYRVVRGYVRSNGTAEDIASEAFMKVYGHWERVRGMENPIGYLVRTGINLAKTRLVRDKFLGWMSLDRAEDAGSRRETEETFYIGEENRILEKELLALREEERNVIIMKDIDGKKLEEVAGILGQKLPTVKSFYRRGKLKLAKRLEEQDAV